MHYECFARLCSVLAVKASPDFCLRSVDVCVLEVGEGDGGMVDGTGLEEVQLIDSPLIKKLVSWGEVGGV